MHVFHEGVVYRFGDNPKPGDYGTTLVTWHEINGRTVWSSAPSCAPRAHDLPGAASDADRADALTVYPHSGARPAPLTRRHSSSPPARGGPPNVRSPRSASSQPMLIG